MRLEERENHGTKVREIPEEKLGWSGHQAIICQFLDWLDGGSTPATVVSDNIRSNALMFAAMEASTQASVVDVNAMIERGLRGG